MNHPNTIHPIQPIRLVSFDVGLKNLAYVVLTTAAAGSGAVEAIERWGVIDVTAALPSKASSGSQSKRPPKAEALTAAIVASLDAEFFDDPSSIRYDAVLVENQPSRKNPAMKAVQVAIVAFFATMRLHCPTSVGDIRLIGATRKLQQEDTGTGGGPTDYRQRKAMSVAACRKLLAADGALADVVGSEAALKTLEAAKKKDDLADAMLQALAYLRSLPSKKRN
jgi:hypothetical protein